MFLFFYYLFHFNKNLVILLYNKNININRIKKNIKYYIKRKKTSKVRNKVTCKTFKKTKKGKKLNSIWWRL